jgi:hypothetical protein
MQKHQQLQGQSTLHNDSQLTKQQVRAMIKSSINVNVEEKMTTNGSSYGIDFSGSILPLLGALTRGDNTVDQYTGSLIRIRSIEVRGVFTTTQTYSLMRLVLFRWLDASIPTPSGIFQLPGNALAPFSPYLQTNLHKIKVLKDELHTLYPVSGSSASKIIEIHLNRSFTVEIATTSNNPQLNGIFLAMISDDGVVVYPRMEVRTTVRYTDA